MAASRDLHLFELRSYEDRAQIANAISVILDDHAELWSRLRARGDKTIVVLKPNWVQHSHEYQEDVWLPVITHPVILTSAMEEVARRLDGRGTICICDAPHTYADFSKIVARGNLLGQLNEFEGRWPNVQIELVDLRREIWIRKEEVIVERQRNADDPRGYVRLDLATDSLFFRHAGEGKYYGADYDAGVVNSHHHGSLHEYLLAGSPVRCDLFINLPKLKTHKKTGITCCLKNLVGINGDKNWLPHHTLGGPRSSGDEYPELTWATWVETYLKQAGRRAMNQIPGMGNWMYRKMRNVGKSVLGDSETVVRNGNWSGNDTCWRMALDLNRALLYGRGDGTFRDANSPKPYIGIVDGIVGGQGNGPLCPIPVASNVIFGGSNPAAIDALALQLMGFDHHDVPIVDIAFENHRWPITPHRRADYRVHDHRADQVIPLDEVGPVVEGGFQPHFGWTDIQRTVQTRPQTVGKS